MGQAMGLLKQSLPSFYKDLVKGKRQEVSFKKVSHLQPPLKLPRGQTTSLRLGPHWAIPSTFQDKATAIAHTWNPQCSPQKGTPKAFSRIPKDSVHQPVCQPPSPRASRGTQLFLHSSDPPLWQKKANTKELRNARKAGSRRVREAKGLHNSLECTHLAAKGFSVPCQKPAPVPGHPHTQSQSSLLIRYNQLTP